MNPEGFPLHRRLDGRAQARTAFDESLATAQQSVRLFDDDGAFWGLERRAVSDALRALLRRRPDASATIVLHRLDHVEARCPRLVELLGSFAPRLQVLRAGDALRGISRGLVIVDDTVVLRRPHFEQPLAHLDHEQAAIAAAGSLYDDIVAQSLPGIVSRVTGL